MVYSRDFRNDWRQLLGSRDLPNGWKLLELPVDQLDSRDGF
jgi:hypothetical protein